jgi:DUF4097 and DUF4098 domain-containing protein YvlB
MTLSARSPDAFPPPLARESGELRRGSTERRWRVVGALSALLSATLLGPACIEIDGADFGKYVERDEKHFSVSGKPDINLRTFDGSIKVEPWDKNEVQVVIEKRGTSKAATDTIEVRADQEGNKITIETRVPQAHGFRFSYSRSASLKVFVPATADVTARSGDGSIELDGVSGHLQLTSGDGSIRALHVGGELDVHTGDGSVTVSGKLAAVRARSGDGSVRINADTGSSPTADWDITTGDGSVTLVVPDGFGAELDAHTGDGGIHMTDITLSNVTGRIGRNSIKGRLGSGGPTVRVRTGDGSISLRRS